MDTIVSALKALPSWLASLPPSAWTVAGSVIAGLFAIFGIWLTNRGHERRLAVQFKNDADSKRIEREHALRKEVGLEALEAMALGAKCIAQLADHAKTIDETLSPFFEKSPALAKAMLVISADTGEQLLKFRFDMASAIAEVGRLRLNPRQLEGANALKTRISSLETSLDAEHLNLARAVGAGDADATGQSQMAASWLSDELERAEEKLEESKGEIGDAQRELACHALKFSNQLEYLAMEICILIRKELALPVEPGGLLAAVEKIGAATMKVLESRDG